MEWLGIFIGIFLIVGLYIGSISLYYTIKKSWAVYKAKTEILFISIAIAFSFVIKFIIFIIIERYNKNFLGGMSLVWHALHAAIGGLTFDGLESFGTELVLFWKMLYYGSSLYAGLITVTVLTLGLSYELYSFARMRSIFKKKKNIYVFTALTEETLQLAKSIKEYETKDGKKSKAWIIFSSYGLKSFDKHDDLCRQVVMEGFLYWSFYRKNGAKKRLKCVSKGESLARVLHIGNHNIRRDRKKKDSQDYRFCVLAYDSKNHIPEEENNIGFVFGDVEKRIEYIEKDDLRIEYYILTKRDINYQAYDYKERELVLNFVDKLDEKNNIVKKCSRGLSKINRTSLNDLKQEKKSIIDKACESIICRLKNVNIDVLKKIIWQYFCDGYLKDWKLDSLGEMELSYDDIKGLWNISCDEDVAKLKDLLKKLKLPIDEFKKLKEEYCKHFVITAVNEPLIIAKDCIKDLQLPFEEKGYRQNEYGSEKLTVYSLGFGTTGQAIARAIHMRSAFINKTGYATDVHFEVFDEKANEISGLFAKEHPMWACKYDETDRVDGYSVSKDKQGMDFFANKNNSTLLKIESIKKSNTTEEIYREQQNERLKSVYKDLWNTQEDLLKKEIVIPTVCFNKKSCFDMSIANKIDMVTGLQKGRQGIPSVIVIALGSDYNNVRMANALVADIIREEEGKPEKDTLQTIIVNLWDSNNNILINTYGGVWSNHHRTLTLKQFNLVVKIVGNNDSIYTYDKMLSHYVDAQYNVGYDEMFNYINDNLKDNSPQDTKEQLKDLITCFISGDYGDKAKEEAVASAYKAISVINNQKADNVKALEKYQKKVMWKRESSASVKEAGILFFNLMKKIGELVPCGISDGETFVNACASLSKVEHQRWVRFYVANGWRYAPKKLEMRKYHDCIMPFTLLNGSNILYDLINVLKTLVDEEENTFDKFYNDIIKTIKEVANLNPVMTDNKDQLDNTQQAELEVAADLIDNDGSTDM